MSSIPAVDVIGLHPDDNICIAARPLDAGTRISIAGGEITLGQSIKMGHKIATSRIGRGQRVLKYGQPIGVTTQEVQPGDWVHSHNLCNDESSRQYAPASEIPALPEPISDRSFLGYRRGSLRAGTRNYVAVISTVNCSASVCKYVAQRFDTSILRDFPNVDGVVAFKHESGCGMPYNSLQHEMLNRVLGGIARHPNIGAYLLIGLGCEQATIGHLLDAQQLVQIDGMSDQRRGPPVFSMQDEGGTVKTIEAAVRKIHELLPQANDVRREAISASELVVATECGGSDGNSGVTANPAVGAACDRIIACGGTAILSETPEIYGAEHLLVRRAVSTDVAQRLLQRVEWWKWYTGVFDARLDNNPSIGNKAGGLTTIAEKSLGAIAKAGSSALVDVYQYAEPVTAKGLVFMDTPGYDPPSVTGMVAGGANIVVFTTGRGSCFGCKPTPSIKVATNTPMYERMIDDMDINAGQIIAGRSVEDVGLELFEEILAVASGKKTKSEMHGFGDEEFIPWTPGPVL